MTLYQASTATLATMHGKERVIAPVLFERLGLRVEVAKGIDTDQLGTFAGEIPRVGTMLEVAVRKARMGMRVSGRQLGLASEGTFGPHPAIPFLTVGKELMVFVDDRLGIVIREQMITDDVTSDAMEASPNTSVGGFLERIGHPDQGVIVRPNVFAGTPVVMKDCHDRDAVEHAIRDAAKLSADGLARLETDMRAHRNPKRLASLEVLSRKLADRIATPCPGCQLPGFGRLDVKPGLPCSACGRPTDSISCEIHACCGCSHSEMRPRPDGRTSENPVYCQWCNP